VKEAELKAMMQRVFAMPEEDFGKWCSAQWRGAGPIKSRREAARFIEKQLHHGHECKLEKGSQHHYGKQELRELMDFIYGGEPTDEEKIKPVPWP
jgi:hypothetical protein